MVEIVDSYGRRGGRDRGMVLLNRDAKLIRIGGRGETRTLSDGKRYLPVRLGGTAKENQFSEGEREETRSEGRAWIEFAPEVSMGLARVYYRHRREGGSFCNII